MHLYSSDLALRMLHSTALAPPAPGVNLARRAWYTNPPLVDNPALFQSPEQMLLVWGADFDRGLVSFRVVHTLQPWKHGHPERIDLSIWLDAEEDFISTTFDTHDDEEDVSMPTREESGEEEGDLGDVSA